MKLIGKYQNGNYTVSIYDDGTKVRENDLDFFEAAFPESADVKITNKCTDPLGKGCGNCKFCHEGSGPNGKHSDALNSPIWDSFHEYTETALGGGSVLEYPDLIPLLHRLKKLKLIPNITVHQTHFMDNLSLLRQLRDEKLIYGLGISLFDPKQEGFIEAVKEFPNAVIHVINGIVTMPQLDALAKNRLKILILGYKQVRRGEKLYESNNKNIEALKNDLYRYLPLIIEHEWFDVVSFDNLAIIQLNPQRLMSKEKWDEMYMGSDGIDGEMTSASMFIDLVERQFARNSCSMERYPLMDNIEDMYNFLRK